VQPWMLLGDTREVAECRWPQNEPDRRVVIGPLRAIHHAADLRRAVLFLHAWGNAADFSGTFSDFGWATQLDLDSTSPTVYPSPEADDPDLVVARFSILWSPHAWDSLLRDIANDRLPSVVVLNPATGEAYAPYDGGADLFLANSERVATLADRWALWLSERPDGL
jgi:hypothetical protein